MNFGENSPENMQNATEVKVEDNDSKFNMYALALREARTEKEKQNARFNLQVQALKDGVSHLPENSDKLNQADNANNYHKKYEAYSMLDLIEGCKLDGGSRDYGELINKITNHIKDDLEYFKTEKMGLDRNFKDLVDGVRNSMEEIVDMIPAESYPVDTNQTKEPEDNERALRFDEFLEELESDTSSILSTGYDNEINYHAKHEAFYLMGLLKENNYFLVSGDCRSLIKKIVDKLQTVLLSFEDWDDYDTEDIAKIQKDMAIFNEELGKG